MYSMKHLARAAAIGAVIVVAACQSNGDVVAENLSAREGRSEHLAVGFARHDREH